MISLTGGELNRLNGKYGISAPDKSVPIIKLIRNHKPKSKEELVKLIKEHSITTCNCGVISKGTIEQFGKNLYECQQKEWGTYKYTLQNCIDWEYNLFVLQSLKGNLIEEKGRCALSAALPQFCIEETNNYYDEELRVDLEIKFNKKPIAGIQIKPESYKYVGNNIKFMNTNRNSLVDYKVFYLYYNYDSEEFINIDKISEEIKKSIEG